MTPYTQSAAHYLNTKVMTATPEQLQMMLYDGAIRFGEQARVALRDKKYEESHTLITKVQRILSELTGSLKHAAFPDLCGKLASLYAYAYRQLIEANMGHKMESLDEALKILRFQRETWSLLMDQLGKTNAAAVATRMRIPAPSARMEASISMQG